MTLSYSQINTYDRCPARYRYAYIEKIPQYLHKSMSFGTSIHNALYAFLKKYGEMEQLHRQHTLFTDETPMPNFTDLLLCLDTSWVDSGYATKEEMFERKKEAIAILEKFYNRLQSPDILFLEKSFVYALDNERIRGRWDRVDRINSHTLQIIDYKTGRLYPVQEDMQLQLYVLALQDMYPQYKILASLYFLEHDLVCSLTFTEESLGETKERVKSIGNAIKRGIFNSTASPQGCMKCPYSNICPDSLAK